MQLTPITSFSEPKYPTYSPSSSTWRKLAAAIATSAALWLPACEEDTTRLAGESPMPEITQTPGYGSIDPKPKPPEPEVQPHPEPRLSGMFPPTAPPPPVKPPPPEVRLGGQVRAPVR